MPYISIVENRTDAAEIYQKDRIRVICTWYNKVQ